MTKKTTIILIFILALAAILRFYRLPELASFTFDEEHQFGLARTLVKDFHIIWIGVSASNLNLYLGPFWVYFTYIWLKISGSDPLLAYYVISGLSVVTALLLFYVGRKIFDITTGTVAGLLYAVLPLVVYHNQKFWNVSIIPLLSLIMFFFLYLALKSPRWWILFFIAFGLVFHTHLSLVPLGLIGVILFIKNRVGIDRQILFFAVFGFFIMLSPLVAFDYFHNWSNANAILHPKKAVEANRINPASHLPYLLDFLGRIWYLKPGLSSEDEIPFVCKDAYRNNLPPSYDFDSIRTKPARWLSYGSLFLLLWFLLRPSTWRRPGNRLLGMGLLSIFGSFLFFPIGPSEYYLIGVFPFFLLLPGLIRASLPKGFSPLFWFGILIVLVFAIRTIMQTDLKYGLGVKKYLIENVLFQINDAPFELMENGICHKYDGWRYLFMVYGRKPERSSTDASLGWLYPEEITTTPAQYKIIMSEKTIVPAEDVSKATVIEKGGFKAYILEL